MAKLTKTLVDNTKPAAKDVWLWDSELPGFGVRVQPSGRKTFVARYRTAHGVQRKATVARCTDLAPDKAREQARKLFGAVASGDDPGAKKVTAATAPTVAVLRDRYMTEHARPFKKESSATNDEINWRVHILPAMGHKRVDSITKADILQFHGSLVSKPSIANACIALLSKAFNLAEDWGIRPSHSNPVSRVRKYKVKQRELILSSEQIADLDRTLTERVKTGRTQFAFAALVRLLLLTGCRKNEIMSARRVWIDFDRRLLLLPDSKVGERKIPLSPACMDIIAQLPDGEWLIPGRAPGEPMQSPYSAWDTLKAAAGLPKALRIHDLRHSYASLAHMAGMTQKQIATALGHNQLSTTERYLHGLKGDQARVADHMGGVITSGWTRTPAPNA